MTESKRGGWTVAIELAGFIAFAGLAIVLTWRTARGLAAAEAWWLVLAAAPLAYLAADLLAGTIHWFCDTFLAEDTPVIGPTLIRGFREHHRDPTGITRHTFLEVNGGNCLAMVPPLAVFVALGGPDPASRGALFGYSFLSVFAVAVFLTNQFHRWAHAERVPPGVRWLQRRGLILTPERHAVHHRGPHDQGYCVTTGWLNPLVDRIGLFSRVERMVRRPARPTPSS